MRSSNVPPRVVSAVPAEYARALISSIQQEMNLFTDEFLPLPKEKLQGLSKWSNIKKEVLAAQEQNRIESLRQKCRAISFLNDVEDCISLEVRFLIEMYNPSIKFLSACRSEVVAELRRVCEQQKYPNGLRESCKRHERGELTLPDPLIPNGLKRKLAQDVGVRPTKKQPRPCSGSMADSCGPMVQIPAIPQNTGRSGEANPLDCDVAEADLVGFEVLDTERHAVAPTEKMGSSPLDSIDEVQEGSYGDLYRLSVEAVREALSDSSELGHIFLTKPHDRRENCFFTIWISGGIFEGLLAQDRLRQINSTK